MVIIDDVAETNPYKNTTNTACFTMKQQDKKARGYFEYNKFVQGAIAVKIGVFVVISSIISSIY